MLAEGPRAGSYEYGSVGLWSRSTQRGGNMLESAFEEQA